MKNQFKIYTVHQARIVAHLLCNGLLHADELHMFNRGAIQQLKRRGFIEDLFDDSTYDMSDKFYRYLRVECKDSIDIPGGSLPTKQWNDSRDTQSR